MSDRDGLWVFHALPTAGSTTECGLRPKCINLFAGYDLYKSDSWDRLLDLRRQRRPTRLRFSLPGTKRCAWNVLGYNTDERQGRLNEARRKERRLLWNVNQFIKEALTEDDTTEIDFEWPHPVQGWHQQPMVDLADCLDQNKCFPWLPRRLDGCNYGLQDDTDYKFIKKQRLIRTP